MTGKTMRIYLCDGLPTGILTDEIMNLTRIVTVGPRSGLAELSGRTDVERTGVTLLVGPDPESPTKDRVYVGKGDN